MVDMTTYRAQVVFPFFTNFPEDVITNTLYIEDFNALGIEQVAALATPRLATFYNSCYSISSSAANYVKWSSAVVHWYDMSQAEPRVPHTVALGATITGSASGTPTEVAAVISFQGLRTAGIPQARRRGRIYLGGLGMGQFSASTTAQFPRFTTTYVTALAGAAENLAENLVASNLTWRVWSPTDQVSVAVANGWVDDSPDTQRRRSVDPTARTLWQPN